MPNDTCEISDLENGSGSFQHGVCFAAGFHDSHIELSAKETHKPLKHESDLFKEDIKENQLQENIPKTVENEKPYEVVANSYINVYSKSCDLQLENQFYSFDNSNSKKSIGYEYFVPELHYEEFEDDKSRNSSWEENYDDFSLCTKSEIRKSKENIFANMDEYTESKNYFINIYHRWLKKREKTLKKLRSLLNELHNDQLLYNKTQALFRGVSYTSRVAKCNQQSQIIDFFASVTALLSEASSGVTSVAQAYNIDCYQSQFEKIMSQDADITKDLYDARSQCIVKYQGIEEVIRTFHADTFYSTVEKISDALELDKFEIALRNADGSGDISKVMNEINKFAKNACESEVLAKIGDSIKSYVGNNPAALEACKSASRAAYEVINVWNGKKDKSHLMEGMRIGINHMLMAEDKMQLERLKISINEDLPQTKLESQIEDAIDNLKSEMEEIKEMYYDLF